MSANNFHGYFIIILLQFASIPLRITMHSPKYEIHSEVGNENAKKGDNAEDVEVHRLTEPFDASGVHAE